MAADRQDLVQHLEHAAMAYGFDLVLPAGRVAARSPRPAEPMAPVPPAPIQAQVAAAHDAPDAVDAVDAPGATVAGRCAEDVEHPGPAAAAAAAAVPTVPRAAATPPGPATTAAAGDAADIEASLAELRRTVQSCTRCKLADGRRHTVFGEGNPRARVLFVGEAPGATEDQTGRPFVGAAGQLLDRIITGAMGLQRQDVYIANINKCRPPGNREPAPDEVAACLPYLRQQVAWIRPEVIVCLGRVAAQNLLGSHESTTRLRGRTLSYEGVPVVVTWHPAYLLRDPSHKRETWEDIKRVNKLLGLPEVPGAG